MNLNHIKLIKNIIAIISNDIYISTVKQIFLIQKIPVFDAMSTPSLKWFVKTQSSKLDNPLLNLRIDEKFLIQGFFFLGFTLC